MRAWAPVIFMCFPYLGDSVRKLKKPPGLGGRKARSDVGARLRYEYQNLGPVAACLHESVIVARATS